MAEDARERPNRPRPFNQLPPFYFGFGNQLQTAHGITYGAYARGVRPTTIEVGFYRDPQTVQNYPSEISRLRLITHEDGVTVDGFDSPDARGDYPTILELAQPLGAWIVGSLKSACLQRRQDGLVVPVRNMLRDCGCYPARRESSEAVVELPKLQPTLSDIDPIATFISDTHNNSLTYRNPSRPQELAIQTPGFLRAT